ncbi:glycosyltransferase family 2 protein [soil metagenome]
MQNIFYKISLVICTYNRDKYLPEALESIRQQAIDATAFQLIIVDNNSTDNSALISKKFITANPQLNIKYAFETNKGLSFARNRGIEEAEAPVISYVDDDAILPPGFLNAMLDFYKHNPQAVGGGGKVIPKYENGEEPAWMNKYLNGFVGKVDHGTIIKKFDSSMKYPAGCNMTYKKDILIKAGGFNNELTFRSDDKYIFFKVAAISHEIYYVPDAYVHHYIDQYRLEFSNFKKLFLKTGNEEKIRTRSQQGNTGVIKKAVEFLLKCIVSVIIYLLFFVKGQSIKGKYVFLSQWFTLKGFFMKEVFVR